MHIFWESLIYKLRWICRYRPKTVLSFLATRMNGFSQHTSITCNLATPFESTIAVYFFLDNFRIVAPAAAEQFATVDSLARGVALSTLSTENPSFTIGATIIRWILAVDEVESTWRFDGMTLGYEAVTIVTWNDLCRTVEGFFQSVTNLAEWWHFSPTSPHGTRTRETVTLALGFHEVSNGLCIRKNEKPFKILKNFFP